MQPILYSKHLLLRSFTDADAQGIYHLLQEKSIADTTVDIPFPYETGDAEAWIASHAERLEQGDHKFAIVIRDSNTFIGAIEICVTARFKHGSLGYWIGKPYWGKGYATEAVGRIIEFGFEDLKLHRIFAEHFSNNVASGRVMEKNGMVQEGRLREHKIRFGKYYDLDIKGLLISDWQQKGHL